MKIHNESSLPTIDYRKLKPLQGNLKDLTKANHDKLLRVLNKRGFTTPVFVWQDGDEMYLMDGHQRSRVMIANDLNDNGSYEVPYVLIPAKDLKEAKEQLLEITSQYGHMTVEGLDEFAFDLDMAELDVNFDAIDMDKFLDNLVDEDEADDEAPEVDEVNPPVSVLGQVYQLGAHRLMCGDSTSLEAVELLMDGAKADMVYTDPPYGMNLDTDWSAQNSRKEKPRATADETQYAKSIQKRNKSKKYAPVIGDDGDYDPTPLFAMFDYCDEIFLWGADYYAELIPNRKQGSWLTWDKRNSEQLDKMMGSSFELVWSKAKHRREIVRSTWLGAYGFNKSEDGDGRVHPTQKPVKLCTWFIEKYSDPNSNVVDLFGGSGSTLISCDKLGRVCYMMELDPHYVDVIRKRYAKHIGSEDWEAVTPAVEYATA